MPRSKKKTLCEDYCKTKERERERARRDKIEEMRRKM
jgi:hypothetical protein